MSRSTYTTRSGAIAREFAIVSIPHTGTHFTADLLTDHGVELSSVIHVTRQSLGDDIPRLRNIVIPMRHPRKVAESWAKRGRSEDWNFVWAHIPLVDGFVFNIEHRDLTGLSEYVGKPLETNWTPKNHDSSRAVPTIPEEQIVFAEGIYTRLTDRRQSAA